MKNVKIILRCIKSSNKIQQVMVIYIYIELLKEGLCMPKILIPE